MDTPTHTTPEKEPTTPSSYFSSWFPPYRRSNSFGAIRSSNMTTTDYGRVLYGTSDASTTTTINPLSPRNSSQPESATDHHHHHHRHRHRHHHHRQPSHKWSCVSPMTRHVIGTPPAGMRRRRSQSFNDYIDQTRHPPPLHIPALQHPEDLIPPLQLPPSAAAGTKGFLPTTTSISMMPPTIDQPETSTPSTTILEETPTLSEQQSSVSQREQSFAKEESDHPPWYINVLYGCINATIVIPVVMSFGNIIYQDPAFQPYTPVLIQLTMVSGVVHQLVFSSLSTLPFAVGSVQDAGLIFLSAMASDMARHCQGKIPAGMDAEEAATILLATVTIGLAIATAILGCGLILVGKLKLAGYIQMLPTCVVAGYLAYIGFFCGKSGLGLMAAGNGVTSDDHIDEPRYRMWLDHWFLMMPGIFGGVFIYASVRYFRHVAVLPTCIALLLSGFYLGLWGTGFSIVDATDQGWIRQAQKAPVWYHRWDYLTHFDKVVWTAYPRLILTELSMILVVALSSSLDVAAVDLELVQNRSRQSESSQRASALDYNHELTMVGVSNFISGLTGGYTGSYIFSQTIFSLRAGIRSRLAGLVLALCQTWIIVTPLPILSYVPNFFYGSLLGMICLDLVYEWLWDVRTKVTPAEYYIGLITFVFIQVLGVEYGIIAGVLLYVVCRKVGCNVGQAKPEEETSNGQSERSSLLPGESA